MDSKAYDHDRSSWALITKFEKFGSLRLGRLMEKFGSGAEVLEASIEELKAAGIPENIATEFCLIRKHWNLSKFQEELERGQMKVWLFSDPGYPKSLRTIHDPPRVLFIRGEPLDEAPALAVVGSRKMTPYGKHCINALVPPLAARGITIVSGLALGCDAEAHLAAVEAKGCTVAVLGSGVDNITPTTNRYVAEKILAAGGTIISEFPPGTEPFPAHFPIRNRIIAGLALGAVIIEAEEESGSLITAKCALDYNRELFAVPGAITSQMSSGTNLLLKQGGAHPVTSPDDILEILEFHGLKSSPRPATANLSPEERSIIEALTEPKTLDELAVKLDKTAQALASTLTLLELSGVVTRIGHAWIKK